MEQAALCGFKNIPLRLYGCVQAVVSLDQNQKSEGACCNSPRTELSDKGGLVKLNLIVAALVIAAVPVCAQAQPTPLTKADAQNIFKIIGGDKAKTQTFCDIGKLGDQMVDANARKDTKKVEELSLKADELGKQLGPEWAALMGGIQDVDPESEVGRVIGSMIQELEKLCAK